MRTDIDGFVIPMLPVSASGPAGYQLTVDIQDIPIVSGHVDDEPVREFFHFERLAEMVNPVYSTGRPGIGYPTRIPTLFQQAGIRFRSKWHALCIQGIKRPYQQ